VLAQFAAAYSLIAQFGVYLAEGHGRMVVSFTKLLALLGVSQRARNGARTQAVYSNTKQKYAALEH
jgi:hypothetical protein